MTSTYKVLGQSNPAGTTLTNVYTVPAATQAVSSSIMIANRGAATTFRLSVAVAGAADDLTQYIAYDVPIAANDCVDLTIGATLGAGDIVRAFAGAATLSFSIFGEEIT